VPGQRGVARRTTPRRRTMRTRIKSGYPVYVRRFKMLLFAKQGKGPFLVDTPSAEELDFELMILDWLEQRIYAHMRNLGISSDQWAWYVGFSKRLWERAVKFAQETFQLEKTSLVTEYTLRGHDPAVLGVIQVEGEAMATLKRGELLPPGWAYDDSTGKIFVQEWGGYDDLIPGTGFICEPAGDAYPNCGGCYDDRA